MVVDSIVRAWSSAPVGSVAQVVGSGSGSSRVCQVVALARLRRGRAVVLVAAGSGPSRLCGRAVVLVLVDSCGSAIRRGAAVSRAAAAPLIVRLVVVLVVLVAAPAPSSPGSSWRSFSHAIGLVRVVEGVSEQSVNLFT